MTAEAHVILGGRKARPVARCGEGVLRCRSHSALVPCES